MINTKDITMKQVEELIGNPDFIIQAMQRLKDANERAETLKKMVDEQMSYVEIIKTKQREMTQTIEDLGESIKQKDFQIDLRDQKIKKMQPKVSYCDLVLSCQGALPITVIAKDYGWSAQRLNQFLYKKGVQYKCGNVWVLYQRYADRGLISTETNVQTNHAIIHTNWTQKGRLFIYNLMQAEGYVPMVEAA